MKKIVMKCIIIMKISIIWNNNEEMKENRMKIMK